MEKETSDIVITADELIAWLEDSAWRRDLLRRAIPEKTKKARQEADMRSEGFQHAIDLAYAYVRAKRRAAEEEKEIAA